MVAIEHRQKSSTTQITTTTQITDSTVLSPTSSSTSSTASSVVSTTTSSVQHPQQQQKKQKQPQESSDGGKMSSDHSAESAELAKRHQEAAAAAISKSSAVSQRNVDIQIAKKSNMDAVTQELTKKVLKLDLTGQDLDDLALKSPKSPITARLPHQTSLTSSVDVEDRKTLREALYQGIFHRHRRTIFAVGSFLRMLRSRNSQYNTIRSSSEGEDVDEVAR